MTTESLNTPRAARASRCRAGRAEWRSFLIQLAVLVAIVAFIAWIARNVVANIARLNINTGFSFLVASRPDSRSRRS